MSNDIDKAKDPMQQFRDRVKEKLKEDIADLLPDDVLAGMVEQAINEEFFKERVTRNNYGSETGREPSWFVQEVVKIATPIIKRAINDYLENHRDIIDKALQDFLTEQNLAAMMFTSLRTATQQDMQNFVNTIAERLSTLR